MTRTPDDLTPNPQFLSRRNIAMAECDFTSTFSEIQKSRKKTRVRARLVVGTSLARVPCLPRARLFCPFFCFLSKLEGSRRLSKHWKSPILRFFVFLFFFFRFFSLQLSLMCDFAVVVIFALAALRFIIKEHGSEYAVRAGPMKQLWLLAESLASKRESLGKA